MPRHKKPAILRKQKQSLITRLMQISIEVDNYIYKNKPISEEDAKSYVCELAQLKSRPGQDARTLQVIEKLTRHMRCIITKQDRTTDLSTENLKETHYTEIKILPYVNYNGINDLPNFNINTSTGNTYNTNIDQSVIHVVVEANQKVGNNVKTNEDLEKLNDNTNIIPNTQQFMHENEEIGLKDANSKENMVILPTEILNQSQSILQDTSMDKEIHRIDVYDPSTLETIPTQQIVSRKLTAKNKRKFLPPTKPIKKSKQNTTENIKEISPNEACNNDPHESQSLNIDVPNVVKNDFKNKKTKAKKLKVQDNINKNDNIKPKPNIQEKIKQHFEMQADNVCNKKNIKTNNISKTDLNTVKTITERNTKTTIKNSEDVMNNIINNNNNLKTIQAVQEDLSWVENIKYVRVVEQDELISDDSNKFWDNITFAGQTSEDFTI